MSADTDIRISREGTSRIHFVVTDVTNNSAIDSPALLRAAPLAALALGAAHGLGANTPALALLQLTTLAAVIGLSTHAARGGGTGASFLSAFAFFAASGAGAHDWIFAALTPDTALGAPLATCVFTALVVGLALLPALSLMLAAMLFTKNSLAWLAPLTLAVTLPLTEQLTATVFGFSWHSIGYSLLGTPLKNLLPFLGVHGTAAVATWLCALPALFMVQDVRRSSYVRAAALSIVVIAVAVVGLPLLPDMTRPTAQPLRARLLQPALPMAAKFDATMLQENVARIAQLAKNPDAHLIVAPETVLPHSWSLMPSRLSGPLLTAIGDGQTFLIGLFDSAPEGGLLNVTVALRPDSARVSPRGYAKRRLVPVSESPTPGLRWLSDVLALPYSDRVAGRDDVLFTTSRASIRPTICLDLAFGADLNPTAQGSELIVNQSDLSALPGARVREQFLTIARVRAMEQRKPVLLATNDGPTAAIDADGRVIARLEPGVTASLAVEVQPRHGRTLYAILGDAGWIGLLAINALAMALRRSVTPRAGHSRVQVG